ncbi:MAG: hypothetical protein ACI86H_002010 [bacterium]|jgi:hypothetical protein
MKLKVSVFRGGQELHEEREVVTIKKLEKKGRYEATLNNGGKIPIYKSANPHIHFPSKVGEETHFDV